jgi:citrate synthase
MKIWLTRDEALKLLKVRPQTLYAYVSRGRIDMRPDPNDSRRSLYRAADIGGLTRRRERGKRPAAIAASTIAWGEPIITTTISTVRNGRLYYRGRDAADLSRSATLEETAALLWESSGPVRFRVDRRRPRGQGTARARAFVALAAAAAAGHPIHGRLPAILREEAPFVATEVAVALGASETSDTPVHSRLAAAWKKNHDAADLIRRALVLHADQELNSSTFAARVAASTGASLAACVLSGFATLSGPLHGDATLRIRSLMDDVTRTDASTVIGAHLVSGVAIPGFGHTLYPEGDPRATALLAAFDPPRPFERMIGMVKAATGQRPNLDFALLAMSERCKLPHEAAFSLFALGRCIGWLAHIIEQAASGELIRPRARYTGPAVDDATTQPDFDLAGG